LIPKYSLSFLRKVISIDINTEITLKCYKSCSSFSENFTARFIDPFIEESDTILIVS